MDRLFRRVLISNEQHLQRGRDDRVMASSGGMAMVSLLHATVMLRIICEWCELSEYEIIITSAAQIKPCKKKRGGRNGPLLLQLLASPWLLKDAHALHWWHQQSSSFVALFRNPSVALFFRYKSVFMVDCTDVLFFFIPIHDQNYFIWDKLLWKSMSSGSMHVDFSSKKLLQSLPDTYAHCVVAVIPHIGARPAVRSLRTVFLV